jgi:hypothetical protein
MAENTITISPFNYEALQPFRANHARNASGICTGGHIRVIYSDCRVTAGFDHYQGHIPESLVTVNNGLSTVWE